MVNKRTRKLLIHTTALLGLATGSPGTTAAGRPELENLKPAVLTYMAGDDFSPFSTATDSLRGLAPDQKLAAEETLLHLLGEPGITQASRIEILAMLELIAGPRSVEPVGRLLTDPQLSFAARRVLQSLDSNQVDLILLAALRETDGDLRIGMMGSLGRRRTPGAVVPLARLAFSDDLQTAEAALRALGEIGAGRTLESLNVTDDLEKVRLDALLQAAETMHRNGSDAEAESIALQLADDTHPADIRLGSDLLLARINARDTAPIVIRMLKSGVPELIGTGLLLVAEARPRDATRDLAELLDDPGIPGVALIEALVNRGDISARAALLRQTNAEDPAIRAAAVRALGTLGSYDEMPMLIARLQADRNEARAAAEALSLIPDIEVDIELLKLFRTFEDPPAADLAGILARRNNRAAIPFMFEAALHENNVGRQAIRALAELAQESDTPELIAMLDLVPVGYRRGIEQAATAAIKRSNQNPPPLSAVLGSIDAASEENKTSLLRIAGAVGGPEAVLKLTEVYEAGDPNGQALVEFIVMAHPNPEYFDLVYRILARTEDPSIRTRLINDCLESARKWRKWKAAPATAIVVALAPLAQTVEEQTLVLETASGIQTRGALDVVQSFARVPELAEAATLAAGELETALEETAARP